MKASELVDALLDDSIDTIISANGGDTQFQIIKYINFDIIKKHPNKKKNFQGFSDNSILTFLLETMSNWNTFYAPCFPTFGYEKWDQTIKDNIELLKGHIIEQYSQKLLKLNLIKNRRKRTVGYNLDTLSSVTELTGLNDFTVSGTLLGGCLDILQDLPKSQYDNMQEYNKNIKILFGLLKIVQ